MTTKNRPRSVVLAEYAEALFGPMWVAPVARLSGLELRQVSRIKAAAAAGRGHPAAQQAITELHAAMSRLERGLRPLATRDVRSEVERRYVRRPSASRRSDPAD